VALRVHTYANVTRRIALFMAALVVPGGLVALFGAWILKAISRTDRGQRALSFARTRVRRARRAPEGGPPLPQAA
jgi:hypothetical protein